MSLLRYQFALNSILAVAGLTAQLNAQSSRTTALIGATVSDGTGAPPVPDAVIVLANGRILQVGPKSKVAIPAEAERRDLGGLTILPGLIDSHTATSALMTLFRAGPGFAVGSGVNRSIRQLGAVLGVALALTLLVDPVFILCTLAGLMTSAASLGLRTRAEGRSTSQEAVGLSPGALMVAPPE